MSIITDEKKIDEVLSRGVEEVIDRDNLKKKLMSGKQLRIKLGIDPTSPNLHLGRSIPLLKLRDFQELGHQIVFIIGDFTGVIGDTSDKDAERPMLEQDTIETNLQSYKAQAGQILDIDKCEVRRNSEWLGKLTYAEIGRQANAFSVAEFIARDNIRKRIEAGSRVSLREMLYPLMQGYDSVAIEVDVELGGTDQRFNLLAGRKLQEEYGQTPQDILMNPIIEGTDGRKMSSSYGNTVNLTDAPNDMFGKVMRVADELMVKYFTMLTRVPLDEVAEISKSLKAGGNPRDIKIKLANEVVRMYHGEKEAIDAEQYFINTFAKKQVPDDMPELTPSAADIVTVLMEAGFTKSTSEARRAIGDGGVKINGEKADSIQDVVKAGDVVQKGKRFFVKIA